jgi:hypothetical protein
MRRCLCPTVVAAIFGLLLGAPADAGAQQPVSEGHPHKWQVTDKSLYDLIAEGYDMTAVVYDTAGTGTPTETPDVHYFLQKDTNLVRCDFRKRGDTSYYWCYLLGKPNQP